MNTRLAIIGILKHDVYAATEFLAAAARAKIPAEIVHIGKSNIGFNPTTPAHRSCALQADMVRVLQKDFTDAIFLGAGGSFLGQVIHSLKRSKRVRTHHLQVGILPDPYPRTIPPLDYVYTHGDHWNPIFAKHNPHPEFITTGSLNVDRLRDARTNPREDLVTIVTQPLDGINWGRYYEDVCQVFINSDVKVKLHPSPKWIWKTSLPTATFEDVANSAWVITPYSTLGLEAAALGINVVGYTQGNEYAANLSLYGLPSCKDLNSPIWVQPHPTREALMPYMANGSQRVADLVMRHVPVVPTP